MKTQVFFLSRPLAPRFAALQARRAGGAGRQRGVVLFFALIVLVILLIGGIVVVRSINSTLLGAGNLAFRRDLTTQSDVVVGPAIQYVSTAKAAGIDLTASHPEANYSAIVLPDTQGIPNALLSDSLFSSVGKQEDIKDNSATVSTTGGVVIRYLIERMCGNTGPVTPANCVQTQGNGDAGGTAGRRRARPVGGAVYRVSARVQGPRNTQAFFQTVFSGPG